MLINQTSTWINMCFIVECFSVSKSILIISFSEVFPSGLLDKDPGKPGQIKVTLHPYWGCLRKPHRADEGCDWRDMRATRAWSLTLQPDQMCVWTDEWINTVERRALAYQTGTLSAGCFFERCRKYVSGGKQKRLLRLMDRVKRRILLTTLSYTL